LRRVLLGESVVRLSGATLQLPDFLSHVRHIGRRGYFLFAYPGYAAALAAQIQDSGIGLPQQPRAVLSYAEALTPIRRTQIEQAFGCPVADHYSSLEVLHIAQTCPDYPALMHINSERAIVRVARTDGKDAAPGERGRVLVTDLANEVMPLINYDLGDWGVAGSHCPCGRGFPTLESIEGRQVEFIRTLSGRLISPATLILMVRYIVGSSNCIREFQAVQTAPDSVTLVLVPTASFSITMEARFLGELKELLGPGMSATVSAVGRIEPEPSGKRPIIKSGAQS
jgi:phenylacetate-CoA ligase